MRLNIFVFDYIDLCLLHIKVRVLLSFTVRESLTIYFAQFATVDDADITRVMM